jgi:hypothetical protein
MEMDKLSIGCPKSILNRESKMEDNQDTFTSLFHKNMELLNL